MSIDLRRINTRVLILSSLGLMHLALLIRRMVTDYSGALFWDEWDARLAMNVPLQNLNWSLFWEQHNEHRIVFSKILFYLDFAWFNGSNFPLLVINVILALLVVLTMYKVLKLHNDKAQIQDMIPQVYCFTLFSLSILQIENFSWGFQSQFYLSILFPLLSFLFYVRYVMQGYRILMICSYLFCVFSIGTMASGNFAIVIILLSSIFLKRPIREVFLHFLITLVLFGLYFKGYSSKHTSPVDTLIQHTDFILQYALVYFASPINKLTNIQNRTFSVAVVVVLFLFLVKKVCNMYGSEKYNWTAFVGLMIFSYSIMVAVASAGGRFDFGLDQATASRYTTISLIGWFGALLIIMQKREMNGKEYKVGWLSISLLITVIFIPFQVANSGSTSDVKYNRDFASIVLLQDMQDDDTSMYLYPSSSRLKDLSQSLIQDQKTIFNSNFKKRFTINGDFSTELINVPDCLGFIDSMRPTSDLRGYVLSGWVTKLGKEEIDLDLIATNRSNQVIGVGLTGLTRDDVANQIGNWAARSGFNIVSREKPSQVFALQTSRVMCELKFQN